MKWKVKDVNKLKSMANAGADVSSISQSLLKSQADIIKKMQELNIIISQARWAKHFTGAGPDAKPMAELTETCCRWPLDNLFCGKKTKLGQSYCEEHYAKSRTRKIADTE